MKIVTYNVNGLRPRISQFGSLRNLLNSFDADIICFQETKLSRQDVTADLVMADGYESFFSCTRTSQKGRTGYSGVITFCRVRSAFSSNEAALPLAAEEGFTGLMRNSQTSEDELPLFMEEDLEDYSKDELLSVDSEGRCIVTDHGHFVLFNIYGPRAGSDDIERIQFKQKFYRILQKRLEYLLHEGRRIFVVGDLNIAPFAIDRCDAGPDFDKNEFRRWFKSMLIENGGHFSDVFRAKHPDKDEYTCWSQSSGAEVFNYGSRIDHILCAGSCLHKSDDLQCHSFIRCHVKECEILTQYKRFKPESTLSGHRWKGGQSIKLEGSDHAPVFVTLMEIPEIPLHRTPSLSARYVPMVRGVQQTLVSLLMKRRVSESCKMTRGDISMISTCERIEEPVDIIGSSTGECDFLPNKDLGGSIVEPNALSTGSSQETISKSGKVYEKSTIRKCNESKKKARKSQSSQLSLRSFFQKSTNIDNGVKDSCTGFSNNQAEPSQPNPQLLETSTVLDNSSDHVQHEVNTDVCDQDLAELNDSSRKEEKSIVASQEWQRIQKLMQNSIPLCKGHKEPCIPRVVKKQGANFGRRFYVCARAEGPASNPEANCGYFKWATSKSTNK